MKTIKLISKKHQTIQKACQTLQKCPVCNKKTTFLYIEKYNPSHPELAGWFKICNLCKKEFKLKLESLIKNNKKSHYNIPFMQAKRSKDIVEIEAKQKSNNVTKKSINQLTLNIVLESINLINQEINNNSPEIINKFANENIIVVQDAPKIERNPKYVHKNKVITKILQEMSQQMPEDTNFQKIIMIKQILKYIEDKIMSSLGYANYPNLQSIYHLIPNELDTEILEILPKEENIKSTNLSSIDEEKELDAIIKRKKLLKKIPDQYNFSKMFENNLKEKMKSVKKTNLYFKIK